MDTGNSLAVKEVDALLTAVGRISHQTENLEFLKFEFLGMITRDIPNLQVMQHGSYNPLKARDDVVEMLGRHLRSCAAIDRLLRDPNFFYLGEHYVREFMAPALRTAACHAALVFALSILAVKLETKSFTSEGNIMLLRMLGEQLQTPYATIDERDKIYGLTMDFAFNWKQENLTKKKVRINFALSAAKGGFAAALIRVVSAPLRPGLSRQDKLDFECSRNEWGHCLVLIISVLINEVPASQSAHLLDQIESEVLAASPWIWKELERYGCEWERSNENAFCFSPYIIQTLCIISFKIHALAKAAGMESALPKMAKRIVDDPILGNPLGRRFVANFNAAGEVGRDKPYYASYCIDSFDQFIGSNFRRLHRRKSYVPPTAFKERAEELDGLTNETRANPSSAPEHSTSSAPSGKLPKKSTSCGHCGISAAVLDKKLLLCSGCKLQRYCSAQCQKDDWKMHKKACKEAQKQAEAE